MSQSVLKECLCNDKNIFDYFLKIINKKPGFLPGKNIFYLKISDNLVSSSSLPKNTTSFTSF